MLGKLIKYEFKASGRLIPLVYVVVGLLGVAGLILSAVKAYIYMGISFFLLFLAGAAAMIITYVIVFLRFYKGMFGAEGYLAMTLPVSSTQVYLSKTIVSVCWMVLSTIVAFISFMMALGAIYRMIWEDSWMPYYLYGDVVETLRLFLSPGAMVFFAVITLVSFLSFTAQVYFCVTLSNVKPFQKLGVGAAIIAFVALQIVTQILGSALTLLLPFGIHFDPDFGWSFVGRSMWQSMTNYYYSDMVTIGLGAYLIPFLLAFGLPALTIWLINRKVNLK